MHDPYLSGEEVTDFTALTSELRDLLRYVEGQQDAVAAKTQPKQPE